MQNNTGNRKAQDVRHKNNGDGAFSLIERRLERFTPDGCKRKLPPVIGLA